MKKEYPFPWCKAGRCPLPNILYQIDIASGLENAAVQNAQATNIEAESLAYYKQATAAKKTRMGWQRSLDDFRRLKKIPQCDQCPL